MAITTIASSPASIQEENFGELKLYIADFTGVSALNNVSSKSTIWNSSLQAVVGYWFNRTDTPTTASLVAVDVSLMSVSNGQFKLVAPEKQTEGKLYILARLT